MDKRDRQVIEAISTWVDVAEKWGTTIRGGIGMMVDADHSALLHRILEGKKVHDVPPPVAFSYPNYALLDDGVWYVEAVESDGFASMADGGIPILIDQSIWKGLERLPNGWIARYRMGRGDRKRWSKKYSIVKHGDNNGMMGNQVYKITEYKEDKAC